MIIRKLKNKRLIISIFVIIVIAIVLSNFINKDIPKVYVNIECSDITDEQYNNDESLHGYANLGLKNLTIQVEIKNSKECSRRDILIPNLDSIINQDKIRLISKRTGMQNSLYLEDTALAEERYIFDSNLMEWDEFVDNLSKTCITVEVVNEDHLLSIYEYEIKIN